jgi:hypothetical protein
MVAQRGWGRNQKMKRSIAAMVLIETDDPRLFPENITVATAAATEQLRAAVIANLPNLTRVVMVLPEENARMMCEAHAMAAQAAGLDGMIDMPPRSYRAGDHPPPYFPTGRRPRR